MSRIILLNKPYGVLTQFTDAAGRPTLKDYVNVSGVYPAGRLDVDSEGLVILTDDGALQAKISNPRHKLDKQYWAQVEGEPSSEALKQFSQGLDLADFKTAPCRVRMISKPPNLWPRVPPIRFRAAIPTSWLEITLREGKNRQVRRMTAKIGNPTLRLIRFAIGQWSIDHLMPGAWRAADLSAGRVPVSR